MSALPENREDVLDPGLPIVDAHHHLWRGDFPMPGGPYLLPELGADLADGHNVEATVFVESHIDDYDPYGRSGPAHLQPVCDTEYVNSIAEHAEKLGLPTRVAAGIVSHADLRLGQAVGEVLDAHVAAAPTRFKGIRQMMAADLRTFVDERRLVQPEVRDGLRQIAARGLTFDVWILHFQLPDLIDTVRAVPELTFVLNHLATPVGVGPWAGRRDEVWQEWTQNLRMLSREPNVVVKLGGMNMFFTGFGWADGEKLPSSQQLADATGRYFHHAIDTFGPLRCLFESNAPPDLGAGSYRTLWNAFKRIAERYSSTERQSLFSETAIRVYRLR
ncbi:MAG: amidohydrolase family protein [Actinomycetota bacterium]|nr:amidohydrolase family protein [Actinomycetota bacterium]